MEEKKEQPSLPPRHEVGVYSSERRATSLPTHKTTLEAT